jgi:hypothetical protein
MFNFMTIRSVVAVGAVVALFSACPVRPTGSDGGRGGGGTGLTGGGFVASGGSAGGSTAGGSTAGGSTAGGSTAGGSTAGGSTAGGSTAGGSTAGGSTAGGSTAGGSTAGGNTGGGSSNDGGVCPGGFGWNGTDFSIAAAKCARVCGDYLEMRGVVVTAVENSFLGSLGDSSASFWVADPRDNRQGMWIRKDFTDLPRTWQPQVGDLLNLRGFYQRQFANQDRTAYRFHLGEGCSSGVRADGGVLVIEPIDAGVMRPALVTAQPGFGDAMNGNARPNAELASARVFIPGPLVLTNYRPPPLARLAPDSGVAGYNGFEVTGGILVNNFATFGTSSDGGPRCDWRFIASALDAGTNDAGTYVEFPNGITGVWDTYAHSPCLGGNGSCSFSGGGTGIRPDASVPFTNNSQTYVLYPTECSELVGQIR